MKSSYCERTTIFGACSDTATDDSASSGATRLTVASPTRLLADRRQLGLMRDGTIALVSWLGSPEGTPVESPDGLARLIDEMETAAMAERPLAMHIVRADGDCGVPQWVHPWRPAVAPGEGVRGK